MLQFSNMALPAMEHACQQCQLPVPKRLTSLRRQVHRRHWHAKLSVHANHKDSVEAGVPPALLSDPQLDDDELCSVEADRMQFVDLFPGGAEGTENFMRGLVKTGVTGTIAILLADAAGLDPLEHWDTSLQPLGLALALSLPAAAATAAITLPSFSHSSSKELQQLQDVFEEVTSRFGGLGYKPDFIEPSKLDAVMGSSSLLSWGSKRRALHLLQEFMLERWQTKAAATAGPEAAAEQQQAEASASSSSSTAGAVQASNRMDASSASTGSGSAAAGSSASAAAGRCAQRSYLDDPAVQQRLAGVKAALCMLQAGGQWLDILARELLLRGCCFLWLSHLVSEQLVSSGQAGVLLLPGLAGAAPQQVAMWLGWAGMMALAVPAAQAAAQPGQMFVRLHVMRRGQGPQLPLNFKVREMLQCTEWEVAEGRLDLGYDPVTDAQLEVRTPYDAVAAQAGMGLAMMRALALNSAFVVTGGNLAASCLASWALDRATEGLKLAAKRRRAARL